VGCYLVSRQQCVIDPVRVSQRSQKVGTECEAPFFVFCNNGWQSGDPRRFRTNPSRKFCTPSVAKFHLFIEIRGKHPWETVKTFISHSKEE
jgi:hypothetical protein